MKLIRNISKARISVNLSFIKPDNQIFETELKSGEVIVVDDSSIETRPVIIQNKKENIEITNQEVLNKTIKPYTVFSSIEMFEESLKENQIEPLFMFGDSIPCTQEEISEIIQKNEFRNKSVDEIQEQVEHETNHDYPPVVINIEKVKIEPKKEQEPKSKPNSRKGKPNKKVKPTVAQRNKEKREKYAADKLKKEQELNNNNNADN